MLEDKYRICLNPKTSKANPKLTGERNSRRGEKNVLHNIVLSEKIREEKDEVPDKIKELQQVARETYKKTEGNGKSSIFDELVQMEKGGYHGADEDKNE
jgi:hypothetical protein